MRLRRKNRQLKIERTSSQMRQPGSQAEATRRSRRLRAHEREPGDASVHAMCCVLDVSCTSCEAAHAAGRSSLPCWKQAEPW